MSTLTRTALGSAVALSVFSIVDAVARALTADPLPWDSNREQPWISAPWVVATVALLSITYLSLAAVLVRDAAIVDGSSRVRRWTRRALIAGLVSVVAGYLLALVTGDSGAVAGLTGTGFAVMFLGSLALGIALLRRRDMRTPAVLLGVGLPAALLAVIALDAIAPAWAHPAYPETVAYLGLALIGWTSDRSLSPAPATHLTSSAPAA